MFKVSQDWKQEFRNVVPRLLRTEGWLIEATDRRTGEKQLWARSRMNRKVRDHLQRVAHLPRRQLGPGNSSFDWYPATQVSQLLNGEDYRTFCLAVQAQDGTELRTALLVDSKAFSDSEFAGELEFVDFCQELVISLAQLNSNALEADIFRRLASAISLNGIVIDSQGAVVANFAHEDGVLSELLRTEFRNPASARKFLSNIMNKQENNADLPVGSKEPRARLLETVHPNGERPAVLHVIPVTGPGISSSGSNVLYVIVQPISARCPNSRSLQVLFSLTPAESRVVRRLVNGMPIQAISRDLNLTNQTVRTYLKRSFEKVGVSSQTQLISKVTGINGQAGAVRPLRTRLS